MDPLLDLHVSGPNEGLQCCANAVVERRGLGEVGESAGQFHHSRSDVLLHGGAAVGKLAGKDSLQKSHDLFSRRLILRSSLGCHYLWRVLLGSAASSDENVGQLTYRPGGREGK